MFKERLENYRDNGCTYEQFQAIGAEMYRPAGPNQYTTEEDLLFLGLCRRFGFEGS